MRNVLTGCLLICNAVLLFIAGLSAQTQYPAIPVGMRVFAGGSGVLPRNTPSLSGTCGTPAHTCTVADSVPPNTYGVVQSDPFVLDAAGWYWERIVFDNGQAGWTSAYPPYINTMTPPQMVQGIAVTIVGDYNGPVVTSASCILDGINSTAVLALQPTTGGQMGTIQCPWGNPPTVGNHKAVMYATNSNGRGPDSVEFQFAVTTAPIPASPVAPSNLRIAPQGGVKTAEAETAKPATTKK